MSVVFAAFLATLLFSALVGAFWIGVHLLVDAGDATSNTVSLQCIACRATIKYTPIVDVHIECSCGNVTKRPKRGIKTTCPRCRETIHLSPRSAVVNVRCPCGNVMRRH